MRAPKRFGVGLCWLVVVTSLACEHGRSETRTIPSPDGTKVLQTHIVDSPEDAKRHHTVAFEIRDRDTGTIIFVTETAASRRMRWSIEWLAEDEVKLSSADIGDRCWKSTGEEWGEAPCSP